jgi:hypothetical protein
MEKRIHCHDGSLAAMIAIKNAKDIWDIFKISDVFGMGSAKYNTKLFDFVISDLIILNSFSGTAYVCLKKEQQWGLLEIKDNQTIQCEWKMISEFTYPTAEKMLSDFKINKLDFIS